MPLRTLASPLPAAVLICCVSACASDPPLPGADHPEVRDLADPPPLVPELRADEQAPVDASLRRLARMFVRYAVGAADSFPHRESISLAIGGQSVGSIDDVAAALRDRSTWTTCPAGWVAYGASSCPIDLLGPITQAPVNGDVLVHSADHGDVICAPARSGPPPAGRMVVIRPARGSRTCSADFALVLGADERGRLTSVDLTLSEP